MNLYIFGIPANIGGASTKMAHLIRLLHNDFKITVVLPEIGFLKDKQLKRLLAPYNVPALMLKDVPKKLEGVALAICNQHFFSSGAAREVKARGLRLVWSNEMMFAFQGEAEAVKESLIDRALFVSEFQANKFTEMYSGVPSFQTGNYIDPDDYAWRERRNPIFTLGRLSRDDPQKYPLDFPVFYEELGLTLFRYRTTASNN